MAESQESPLSGPKISEGQTAQKIHVQASMFGGVSTNPQFDGVVFVNLSGRLQPRPKSVDAAEGALQEKHKWHSDSPRQHHLQNCNKEYHLFSIVFQCLHF